MEIKKALIKTHNIICKNKCEVFDNFIKTKNIFDINLSDKLIYKNISNNKKRLVVFINDKHSYENIVINFLTNFIVKKYNLKLSPNNIVSDNLICNLLKLKNNFAIFKFDFKSFSKSISTEYVCEKFLKNDIDKDVYNLLHTFAKQFPYLVAGLPITNCLCNLLIKKFTQALNEKFALYKPEIINYYDDYLLIFKQHLDKENIRNSINECVEEIFYDNSINIIFKNKIKIDNKNIEVIDSSDNKYLNFLGLNYKINNGNLVININENLRNYFCNNIKKNVIILKHNIPALTIMLKFYSYKTVFKNYYNKGDFRYRCVGIVQQYSVLRKYQNFIGEETKLFLSNLINDIVKNEHINIPVQQLHKFNIWENLINKKTTMVIKNNESKKTLIKFLTDLQNAKVIYLNQDWKNLKSLNNLSFNELTKLLYKYLYKI